MPAMLRMQGQSKATGSPGGGGQAELLASITALPDESSRREAIVKSYASMDGEGISTVVERAEQEGGVWKEMLQVLQELTNARHVLLLTIITIIIIHKPILHRQNQRQHHSCRFARFSDCIKKPGHLERLEPQILPAHGRGKVSLKPVDQGSWCTITLLANDDITQEEGE